MARQRRTNAQASVPVVASAELIADGLAAGLLAQRILDPARTTPVVLVTTDAGQQQPYVPVEELVARAGARAHIVVVPHHLTNVLTERLSRPLSAFRGACRVYPPGDGWTKDVRQSPLRLGDTPEHRARLLELLVGDLDRAASKPPLVRQSGAAPVASARPTPGIVAAPGTSGVFRVDSVAEAEDLARYLLDPERSQPVVVVTSAAGQSAPYLEMDALAENLRGLADLCEMPTGPMSWAFTRQMPEMCDVYGGAARVYPPGDEWTRNPYAAPLRFVYGPGDGPAAIAQLTTDAMRAIRAGGSFGAPVQRSVAVHGTVLGVTAGRGLVQLTRGASGLGSVWTDLVAPGVDETCVLTKGMAIAGILDLDSRRLDVSPMLVAAGEALADYQVGSVVLGVARSVERALCVVEPFPDFPVSIEPDGVVVTSRLVDLRTLISEGEVLVARVLARGESPEDWQLSLVDVSPDDVPLPAPSILSGGPSWLVSPVADEDVLVSPVAEAPAVVVPPLVSVPAPRTPPAPALTAVAGGLLANAAALDSLTIERDALLQELQREREAARLAVRELGALRTAVRKETRRSEALQARLTRAEGELGRSLNDEALFADPIRQLAFEVDLAWARRVPAEQKDGLPLASWTVGPDFFASWAEVEGVARSKVVDVIVEVLTGRAYEFAGREAHQLRTGPGGDDPPRMREDGATCWRVSLQVKTPSARRLHYWLLNDGSIELSSIRLHDDMRP
ncbi:MAG: hypothetical protein IPM11_01685 [Micropruina sp.]|nr:hypothetical protein [Micropruina sp.]